MAHTVPQVLTTGLEATPSRLSLGTESAIQQDKAALQDARLRSVWDSIMTGASGPWQPHVEASVLMLSWADEWNDLNTSTEVLKLGEIFTEKFNYKVLNRKIEKNGPLPQHQIAYELALFVRDHDKLGSLLIVYYAGHGIGGSRGTLILQGENEMSSEDKLKKDNITRRNAILWHEVEIIIKRTQADVLTIFDCCFAGNLVSPSGRAPSPMRNFEFLAATGKDTTTPRPGPYSFTTALIWSLDKLVARNTPFSTSELFNQIGNEAPDFPRKKQTPILKQRFEESDRRLMLAPIPKEGEIKNSIYQPLVQELGALKQSIDFRFFFDEPPNDEDVRRLSTALKELIEARTITATRVGWGGLSTRDIVRAAAMRWRRATIGRKRSNSSLSAPGQFTYSPLDMNAPSFSMTHSRGEDLPSNEYTEIVLGRGGTGYHLKHLFDCLTRDLLKSMRTTA